MPTVASWPDSATLATIASVIAAFAVTMLFFRVQREFEMESKDEINWIPWADRLLLFACTIALLFVLLPLVIIEPTSPYQWVPSAACAAAIVLLACYPFALLAHYRFLLPFSHRGRDDRINPEPGELLVVAVALLAAAVAAFCAWRLHAQHL